VEGQTESDYDIAKKNLENACIKYTQALGNLRTCEEIKRAFVKDSGSSVRPRTSKYVID